MSFEPEFYTPFRVTESHTLAPEPRDFYVPTVENSYGADVTVDGQTNASRRATGLSYAVSGHTGQHGYNGAVMHASELFAGLERHLEPGTYVLVPVDQCCLDFPGETAEGCDFENGCQCEPAGWAILRLVAN